MSANTFQSKILRKIRMMTGTNNKINHLEHIYGQRLADKALPEYNPWSTTVVRPAHRKMVSAMTTGGCAVFFTNWRTAMPISLWYMWCLIYLAFTYAVCTVPPVLAKKLEAIGLGFTTRISMPSSKVSAASDAPKFCHFDMFEFTIECTRRDASLRLPTVINAFVAE